MTSGRASARSNADDELLVLEMAKGHWCSPICSCCHSWPSSDAQRPEIITGSWWWQPAEAAKSLQIDLDALFAEALGER